jgi:hypothetical protein
LLRRPWAVRGVDKSRTPIKTVDGSFVLMQKVRHITARPFAGGKTVPPARRLRSDAVPRNMLGRTEGGDFTRFAEHFVDFACVKLLGIDHLPGVLLNND